MDVNADRVSALMILMIFREELDVRIEQRKQNNIKTTAQSDFWGRAYGNFRKDKVHRKLKNLTNYDFN
jgi:regulation of enolase protein 1 (concanavalin A-like superfamily)